MARQALKPLSSDTNSGKSTLLLTLLRLLTPSAGKIELDGIDLKDVKLELLRQRCFIAVSQDPLLLSNETLRFNLDPDDSASDEVLIAALDKVGLWTHFQQSAESHPTRDSATVIDIPDYNDHPILDRKVSQLRTLSVGQSQLFALSRALVKAAVSRESKVKPVLLLDEVTSSLDPPTEATILRVIDEEFTGNLHTVVIITHRLGALEEYVRNGRDAVAFIADGRLVEVVEDLRPATFQRFRGLE